MLAASAVAGSRQKFDARAGLQDDLLAPDGRLDLGHMPAQLRPLKEVAHLFK